MRASSVELVCVCLGMGVVASSLRPSVCPSVCLSSVCLTRLSLFLHQIIGPPALPPPRRMDADAATVRMYIATERLDDGIEPPCTRHQHTNPQPSKQQPFGEPPSLGRERRAGVRPARDVSPGPAAGPAASVRLGLIDLGWGFVDDRAWGGR